jgi:hypothetical protein
MPELPNESKLMRRVFDGTTVSMEAVRPEGPPGGGRSTTEPGPERDSGTLPDQIGKYVVVDRLGAGAQGSAWLARDPDFGRFVVLKRYQSSSGDPECEAALQDGKALARLRSRFTPQCYGLERYDDALVLVMEYIPGQNLAKIVETKLPDAAVAARWVEQVAEGLEQVHACGLLHRDIKPSNVVLGDDGVPRLVDFGLAAHLGSAALEGICGTPRYMAPEQARGQWERIDGRTDVYGLGAVLYTLLTGQAPHGGATFLEVLEHARRGEVTPPRALKRSVPRGLEAIALKAMAADPVQRYSTAAELRRALRRYRTWHDHRRALAGLAALLVIALVAVASAGFLRAFGIGKAPSPYSTRAPVVMSFEVVHDPYRVEGQSTGGNRVLGRESFEAAENDYVRVSATLSEPAYCYLVALNPDGSHQLCYPPGAGGWPDETIAPPATDRIDYPAVRTRSYQLTDGPGQQAFVLLVATEPFPPFAQWRGRLAAIPWPVKGRPGAGPGVWGFDDRRVQPIHPPLAPGDVPRGTEVERAPAGLDRLCAFLRACAPVSSFRGVVFPVR